MFSFKYLTNEAFLKLSHESLVSEINVLMKHLLIFVFNWKNVHDIILNIFKIYVLTKCGRFHVHIVNLNTFRIKKT